MEMRFFFTTYIYLLQRTNFQQLRGNGFLHSAITGGGFFSAKVRSRFQDFMDRNFRLATQIAEATNLRRLTSNTCWRL